MSISIDEEIALYEAFHSNPDRRLITPALQALSFGSAAVGENVESGKATSTRV
jgi:hypothetical protein